MRLSVAAIFLSYGLTLPSYGQEPTPPAIPVSTIVATRTPIAKTLEFVGRVDAINRVEVKARVTGFLDAVLFKEGDFVKEGAPLYRIEKGLFEAAVKQAEGALERAKSAKLLSEIQLQRAQELLDKSAGTVVVRDQAKAGDEQAQGAILEAEANLQTAKINLGYTDIVSPISGKIGRTSITKGNVVGPNTGTLTTIVSQDPMYVTFPVSQREFLRAQQTGQRPNAQSLKVRLRYSDGTFYDQMGVINFLDVSVDRSTDTVTARASVPNPNGGLTDGQLMRVVVEIGQPEEKIIIPQAALIADQEGVYVFVVENGKVAIKRVTTGGASGRGIIIQTGLAGGELVVVEGLQSVRPGVAVRATPIPPSANPS